MTRTGTARLKCVGMLLGTVLATALGADAARALMPPYVYESARNNAASVLVIAVDKVTAPKREFGNCAVEGTVRTVERGAAYKVGEKVTIDVPCAKPDAFPPIGGTIYQNVPDLKASKFGRAYLDGDGKVVLSQYEQLAAAP